MYQPLGQLGPLLHAGGVLLYLPVPLLPNAHEVQHVVGPAQGRVGVEATDAAHVGHEANARHLGDEAVVLRHVADALPYGQGTGLGIQAKDGGPPSRGPEEPQEKPEKGRLPGAVGTQEADGSLGHLQGEAIQGYDIAKPLCESLGLDDHLQLSTDACVKNLLECRPGGRKDGGLSQFASISVI